MPVGHPGGMYHAPFFGKYQVERDLLIPAGMVLAYKRDGLGGVHMVRTEVDSHSFQKVCQFFLGNQVRVIYGYKQHIYLTFR